MGQKTNRFGKYLITLQIDISKVAESILNGVTTICTIRDLTSAEARGPNTLIAK